MLIRLTLAAALLSTPVLAADAKEEACRYEAQVMAAVQQARLDRVAEAKVADHLAASEPSWPENYNAAIPQMVGYVFQMKRRELKQNDLGALWEQQCLQTWDQRQQMLEDMKN